MLESLWTLDLDTLRFFNVSIRNDFFDMLFPYLTDPHKIKWLSYFVAPIFLFFWFYKQKILAVYILLYLVLVVGVSDQIGYKILKPAIGRDRPNNEVRIKSWVKPLKNPTSHSFPSNHAMNTFALVTSIILIYPFLKWWLLPFATLISLTRVYAGVHYFSDILGGAFLGSILAVLLFRIFRTFILPYVRMNKTKFGIK